MAARPLHLYFSVLLSQPIRPALSQPIRLTLSQSIRQALSQPIQVVGQLYQWQPIRLALSQPIRQSRKAFLALVRADWAQWLQLERCACSTPQKPQRVSVLRVVKSLFKIGALFACELGTFLKHALFYLGIHPTENHSLIRVATRIVTWWRPKPEQLALIPLTALHKSLYALGKLYLPKKLVYKCVSRMINMHRNQPQTRYFLSLNAAWLVHFLCMCPDLLHQKSKHKVSSESINDIQGRFHVHVTHSLRPSTSCSRPPHYCTTSALVALWSLLFLWHVVLGMYACKTWMTKSWGHQTWKQWKPSIAKLMEWARDFSDQKIRPKYSGVATQDEWHGYSILRRKA